MMKFSVKKLVMWMVVFVMVNAGVAKAAVSDEPAALDPDIDGNVSLGRCVAKGNLDFIGFLDASLFADGFDQAALEQFRDVLGRNQCHYNDISSLIGQRNKLRSQIRDAFLTCDTERLPALVKGHARADAEIYYVRHVVDGGAILKVPYTSLELSDSYYYPTEKLYAEMQERYVESGDFSSSEFNVFFDSLQAKYQTRKESYVMCESSSWEQVERKWEEFSETLGGIAPEFEELEKSVAGRGKRLINAFTDTTYRNYINGIIDINLNNLDLPAGFDEILGETEQFLPESTPVTQESILGSVQRTNTAYDIKMMEENLRSDFTLLYKDTSDETVSSIIENLEALNQAIVDSYTPQAQILDCVETINNRQCPTTE